jgi:tRNA (guanine37-N1)-methyltransferase
MLRIQFLTLFPEMVLQACRHSILGRAASQSRVEFGAIDPRDFTYDRHGKVDDKPYGDGPGMLIMVEPVDLALQSIGVTSQRDSGTAVVLTDPTGALFTQDDAIKLSKLDRVIFLCGHYEGFDERVRDLFATHVFSIGDYVLTGGELPSLVMADAIVRNVPDVLGSPESLGIDSHSNGLLSAPQYTKPHSYRGLDVPEVLMAGNHKAIAQWRKGESLRRTRETRPDLLAHARMDIEDIDVLSS